jgi:cytoskeletal protein CcmA (bactofilin family)
MFRKKEESGNGKSTSNTTLIAGGTRVVGDIRFSGHLEIEGEITGNIHAEEDENALVRILQNGYVKGEIRAPRVVINGKVEGDVYSTCHLELAAKAEVEGDVHYDTIEMVRGAHINGNLMFKEPGASPVKLVADSTVAGKGAGR